MNEREHWVSRNADTGDFARDTINDLAALFHLLGLRHALGGGHAVNQYTSPRLTYDLDFIVEGGTGAPNRCLRLLEMAGYVLERREGVASDATGAGFVRLKHRERGVVIDIQEARTSFEWTILDRARAMGDLPFPVVSAEDLVVMKLVSDRQRDQRDVLELAALPGLDIGYIRTWAKRWEVMPAFNRLIGGAAPGRSL